MNIDIRTLFVIQTAVAILNGIILSLVWHYAKSMRKIIGYWSLNLTLVSLGAVLTAFRGIVPDFLSVIIANICISVSYLAMQQGVSHYIDKKGYFGAISAVIVFLQSIFYLYFYFIVPSISSRILVYNSGSLIISLLCIFMLKKLCTKADTPIQLFIALLTFNVFILIYRMVAVTVQGEYADYLNSGTIQALGLLASLLLNISTALGYFWLITHKQALEIKKQAYTDSLTGIPNRRAMEDYLQKLLTNDKRHSFGILLIDVDKFKYINDSFGHQAGDLLLINLGNIISNGLRKGGTVFRYAGDEFVAVVPDTDLSNLMQLAELLRQQVEELFVTHRGNQFNTTVSIGLALINEEVKKIDDMFMIVDKALYKAKGTGRNCVISDLLIN